AQRFLEAIADPLHHPLVDGVRDPRLERLRAHDPAAPLGDGVAEPLDDPTADPFHHPLADSAGEPLRDHAIGEPLADLLREATGERPLADPVARRRPPPLAEPLAQALPQLLAEVLAQRLLDPLARHLDDPVGELPRAVRLGECSLDALANAGAEA